MRSLSLLVAILATSGWAAAGTLSGLLVDTEPRSEIFIQAEYYTTVNNPSDTQIPITPDENGNCNAQGVGTESGDCITHETDGDYTTYTWVDPGHATNPTCGAAGQHGSQRTWLVRAGSDHATLGPRFYFCINTDCWLTTGSTRAWTNYNADGDDGLITTCAGTLTLKLEHDTSADRTSAFNYIDIAGTVTENTGVHC